MLHAELLLSPHPHARIVSIDTARAASARRVARVVTAADLSGATRTPTSYTEMLLARDRVLFAGQPVAVVLAEDAAAAQDALSLIDVRYEALPAAANAADALEPRAPLVWPHGVVANDREAAIHGGAVASSAGGAAHGNLGAQVRYGHGDVETGFREADVVVERTYHTHAVHQGYLEPHATVAAYDPPTGQVTIWTGTQGQFQVRTEVARTLGLPERVIRVVPMAVGGGFGGKILLFEALVAQLAILVRRPVRLVLTRAQEFLAGTPAPACAIQLKMGARRDGMLTAAQARIVLDSGIFPATSLALTCLVAGWTYAIPHLDIRGTSVLTHKTCSGSYRAPGGPPAVFAVESHMDDLARRLEIDPMEFRLKNVIGDGARMPDGMPWPALGLRECVERLRAHPVWIGRSHRSHEGYGIAIAPWRGGVGPAAAACSLDEDGSLRIVVGSVDITGTHTSLAVIASETFGIPAEMVHVETGDTQQAPYAGTAGGSQITFTVGLAVREAAADARRQLLAIAANELEARADDLEVADGYVRVRGVPERRRAIGDLARLTMQYGARYAPVFGRGTVAPKDRASGSAAHLAHVAVDPETGQVKVLRYVAVQDVGFAINPAAVRGQIMGGVVQGIGWALFERLVSDEHGHPLTTTLADYALPSFAAVPAIDVELVEVPLPHTPFGARGVGEPPVIPGAAAIANAIYDATGVRISEIPCVPSNVFAALRNGTRDNPAAGAR